MESKAVDISDERRATALKPPSEMGLNASTDFDERNSHDNSILNILESSGRQIYFQVDKDWHYRAEERRWVTLNDKSGWQKVEMVDGEPVTSKLHVR